MFEFDKRYETFQPDFVPTVRQLKQSYEETSKELSELKESMVIPEKKPGLPTKLAEKHKGNFFLSYSIIGLGLCFTELTAWGVCVSLGWILPQAILGPMFYFMFVWWLVTSFFVGLLVHKHKGFDTW